MLENLKFFFSSILKAVNLDPRKQVILLCFLIILSTSVMGIKLYKKTELTNSNIELERNEYKTTIKELELKIDSIYILWQKDKENVLTEKLRVSDSLLRESHNIQNSIKPLVKKLNKKINEVNK